MSNRWTRPDGVPSCVWDVAGVAALREEQGDLMGRSHATTQRPQGGNVLTCFMNIHRLVHPLALPGLSPGLPREVSNRWTRQYGVPPCVRDVAGLAALREEQGDLMGRSHATTQRRDVRKHEN
jgi:hypothetical protein